MEKAKTFVAILGLGVTIGLILAILLINGLGAKPTKVNIGGVEFEISSATASTQTIQLATISTLPPTLETNQPSALSPDTANTHPVQTSNSCPSSHLGAGKQFRITMQNGCYYHFNISCNGCASGQENNYVVNYSGDPMDVIVPDGSVWQYGYEPTYNQFSADCGSSSNDFWPEQLPTFLNFSGVRQIWPCREQ